jgi:predicted nucleotidyltransferase
MHIRVADVFIVDLLLNANGQSFDTLSRYAQTIDLDGIPVKTVSLEGLLLTKRTMRDKDAVDRIVIERALEALRASDEKRSAD